MRLGDKLTPPSGATTLGNTCLVKKEGVVYAARKMTEEEVNELLSNVAAEDARILAVTRARGGWRHKTWAHIAEDSSEQGMDDWPPPPPRTATWRLEFLQRRSESIEQHHEALVRACKLDRTAWGVQAHWQACNPQVARQSGPVGLDEH